LLLEMELLNGCGWPVKIKGEYVIYTQVSWNFEMFSLKTAKKSGTDYFF